jgi:hypothetical protein
MKTENTMIDLILKVIEATEQTPNDFELGRKIRQIICESK